MNKLMMIGSVMALGVAGCTTGFWESSAVTVVEDAKCAARIVFAKDGKSAVVNKAALKKDNPNEKELARRVKAMMARAEKLLIKPDPNVGALTRPLMGWSSWNTYRVNISEDLILDVARTMKTNGLQAAGYRYINTDDGFFGGRDKDGNLQFHKERFPKGLKRMVDGIHALGFKAGIYSEAGADTCGSMFDNDKSGVGAGLYGHDAADCKLYFNDLGFDFIKVDFCGGQRLKLNEQKRYTEIANAIKATGRSDIRFNICRWTFPGTWAADIAGSWRTTADIAANGDSVRNIIRQNLYLSAYCKPGHYNDMDMLEIGRLKGTKFRPSHGGDKGLTPDEELTHFGMWCIMSSPLLIGGDPRTMQPSSLDMATNPYLLAMSQNDLGLQAYVASRRFDTYVLVKDADEKFGKARYVALLNLSQKPVEITIRARDIDLGGRIDILDLVQRADVGSFTNEKTVEVPAFGSKFYRLDAEARLDRVVYEAEDAFLTKFSGVHPQMARPAESPNASGGMVVWNLGRSGETNDLIWKDVKVSQTGDYELALEFLPKKETSGVFLQIDGGEKRRLEFKPGDTRVVLNIKLEAGLHTVRLFNPTLAPDFDRMTLMRKAK